MVILLEYIEKCFHAIKASLTNNEYDEFIKSKYENLYLYHFSIGLFVRNTLLQNNKVLYRKFLNLGITQKDIMSEIIIQHFYLCQREKYAAGFEKQN